MSDVLTCLNVLSERTALKVQHFDGKNEETSLWQPKKNLANSPFAHRIHVHAHSRDLAAAVLVKLVATCLTSEAIKEKLVAKITVSQLEKSFPYLQKYSDNAALLLQQNTEKVRWILFSMVLTKLCMVRGISSRTSTRSSSPTRGVMSVVQSVSLLRLGRKAADCLTLVEVQLGISED